MYDRAFSIEKRGLEVSQTVTIMAYISVETLSLVPPQIFNKHVSLGIRVEKSSYCKVLVSASVFLFVFMKRS